MRQILLILTALMMAGVVSAAAPKQVSLHVENMTCPACAITIEKTLGKVAGVAGQNIATESETVTVTFDPERTNAAEIAKAITDAGFPAKVVDSDG